MPTSGAFQSDAFQNDAFQVDGTQFTADAVIKKTVAASLTADAIKRQTQTGSFPADAVIVNRKTATFTADAVIRKTTTVGLAANAIVHATQSSSFTAGAELAKTSPHISQYVTGDEAATITMPAAISQGHTLVFLEGGRNVAGLVPTGYTAGPDGVAQAQNNDNCEISTKTAGPSESTSLTLSVSAAGAWLELDRASILDQHAKARDNGVSFGQPTVSITATGPSLVVCVATAGTDGGWGNQHFTPPAGWTEIVDHKVVVDHPTVWIGYRYAAAGEVVTANPVCTANGWWSIEIASFVDFNKITADAILKKTLSGSFTANSVLALDRIRSFTADATLRRSMPHSMTADAVLSAFARITHTIPSDAVIKSEQTHGFYASAWIKKGTTGVTGEAGVHIKVGGVDVTDDVEFRTAEFTMLANGAVGSFEFRVRDTGHTHDFTSGAEVTLDIDGVRKFGGFLMQPSRVFAFDVQDTTNPTTVARYWVLRGVDYNILFLRRVIYDKANPANVNLRSWPADSRDDDVIKYVFDNYTDLPGDGATYEGVTHIGTPNPDRTGVVGSGGLTFGDAMHEINRLIGGLYYFSPYKDLAFVDVETATSLHGLSDHPVTGETGFREFERAEDGARLANDAMIWGAAAGAPNIAYARVQDAASQAEHGLWQYGEYTSQLYRQASVDKRADSVVNGSPQSKRGGKDDQVSWGLVTYDTSFSIGDKVAIESEVWGVSDVVPIRRLKVTFPTKRQAKFTMVLSHEIDEPWNMFEFLPFKLPPFPPPYFPPPNIPFDARSAHWYYGTFTFAMRSGSFGTGPSGTGFAAYGGATIYSSNTEGALFFRNTTYAFAMGMLISIHDYAPAMAMGVAAVYPANGEGALDFDAIGAGGTFTTGTLATNPERHHASASLAFGNAPPFSGFQYADHTAVVTWWVDPLDWVPTNVPTPGQTVINDRVVSVAGQTHYFTAYPYVPGTLVVRVITGIELNGDEISSIYPATEINPSTGEFSIAQPPADSFVEMTYVVAGSGGTGATYYGPVIEQAVRVDATHYEVSFAIVSGSESVWVDRLYQMPGATRDYVAQAANGVIEFNSPVDVNATVWVNYFANGVI